MAKEKNGAANADLAAEGSRNGLLRRVDWRFLLPGARPGTCLGLAHGPLEHALRLLPHTDILSRGGTPSGGVDLAVLTRADRRALREAWQKLRPGGAVYVECRSRRPWPAAILRRRLRAVRFEDIRLYWPRPDPDLAPTRTWLPLDSPGALAHHLGNRVARRGRFGRLRSRITTQPWALRLRMGLARPACAIAIKPRATLGGLSASAQGAAHYTPPSFGGPTEAAPFVDAIRRGWEGWGLGPSPKRLHVALLTGGSRTINKVVALVFPDEAQAPSLAVKIARGPETNEALDQEAAVLLALEARKDSPPGIPRVLFRQEHAGLLAVGETPLGGRPLYTALRVATARDLALKATQWLITLAGSPDMASRAEWWAHLAVPALRDFDASFGSIIDPGMRRATEEALAALDALPVVCEHRDFASWNILVGRNGELAILDWESAELRGLPAHDLIYFLTYLGFGLDRARASGRYRPSYRSTFDLGSRTGQIAAECLSVYTASLGLSRSALHPLRLLTWLIHSRSDYRHMTADAGRRPEPAHLRQSLFLGLWEEEVRRGQARDV